MQVTASFRPRRQPDTVVTLVDGATVADLLAAVGQDPAATLALRAGRPATEDVKLADGDVLTLLSAFSGG